MTIDKWSIGGSAREPAREPRAFFPALIWTKHGEREIMLDNNEEEENMIPDFAANYDAFFDDTAMSDPEEDTEGYVVEDDLGQMLHEAE